MSHCRGTKSHSDLLFLLERSGSLKYVGMLAGSMRYVHLLEGVIEVCGTLAGSVSGYIGWKGSLRYVGTGREGSLRYVGTLAWRGH